MLPTSSYDAYYVQHSNGGSGSTSSHPGATQNHPHGPFVSAPMIGSSNVNFGGSVGSQNGGGAEAANVHHQQQHRSGIRQSPSTPTSQLPWRPPTPSSSKESFGSPFQHAWNDYQPSLYQQASHDTINHAQLYSHYAHPLGPAFDGSHVSAATVYDDASLATTFVPANESLLLSGRYDLDSIGDDSGSGGMTRPKPKKRRKVSSKHETESVPPLQRMRQALMDDVAIVGPASSSSAARFQEEAEDQNGLGSMHLIDESTSVSSSYNDVGDNGVLGHGVEGTEDEPLYVNPKQYNRILKRREVRAQMEEKRRRTEEAIRTGKLDVKKLTKGKDVAKAMEEDDKKVREVGARQRRRSLLIVP